MSEPVIGKLLLAALLVMLAGPVETRPPVALPDVAAKVQTVDGGTGGASGRVSGSATYYAYHRGQAAAGPGLRRALGPTWRGQTVVVNGTLVVVLTDWCLCKGNRIIDLDKRDFATLAPTWRGVIPVVVTY